jgi:hypothetical protein
MAKDRKKNVSMEEIEAEDAVSLPNKEVMSLLDVNANVDLGLDLAAPVDLAAAANLNVAAPIEASAAANVLSPGAQAVSEAYQHGSIDQSISGSADATAPQHATVAQDSTGGAATGSTTGTTTGTTDAPAAGSAATGGAAAPADGATSGATSGATGAVDGATSGATGAVDGATSGATSGVTGSADSLLNGGSLLDANVNIHAAADLAAPVDGAVAANANVAAPIDAAVAANVGSPNAGAEALAPQEVDISQHLDGVEANATAEQNASVNQK